MLRKMAGMLVLLAASAVILAGCSQEEAQKAAVVPAGFAAPAQEQAPDGKALFKQYCASCHPDGGNVSDPKRTLHGSALKRNKITTPEDIVRIMRNPLSRMIRFDPSTLSDRDARAIAEYILVTFK
jgi:cytochrome c6